MSSAATLYPYPADLDSDTGFDEEEYEAEFDDDAELSNVIGRLNRWSLRRQQSTASFSGNSSRSSLANKPLCIACGHNPQKGSYRTCSLTCYAQLSQNQGDGRVVDPQQGIIFDSRHRHPRHLRAAPVRRTRTSQLQVCVVCKQRSSEYVTCSKTCLEQLWKNGGDATVCDYCHRAPRLAGQRQCSSQCVKKAKVACLLCKARPKNGHFHFCGMTCRRVAAENAPLILEIPRGHVTFERVEKKYQDAWTDNNPGNPAMPPIKKIYKVIEKDEVRKPYDDYRATVDNEQFRYHGTKRQCQVGSGTSDLCSSPSCSACCITKTSFKKGVSKTNLAFGQGIYTSSTSHRAFTFCGPTGVMILAKVVLGNIRHVQKFKEVLSLPQGFNSVSFENMKGNVSWNETVVYSDEAIRPVFLIAF